MTVTIRPGERTVKASVDDYGYRTYDMTVLVETTSYAHGPFDIMTAVNTAIPVGSTWAYGQYTIEGTATFSEGEVDPWAWRRPRLDITIHDEREGDRTKIWKVTMTFSNKPLPDNAQRCQSTQITDPLLEPAKVSGTFVKTTLEAMYDRFGNALAYSSHEPIRGPQAEFDASDYSIEIEQNVATLAEAATVPYLLGDYVNDAPMWGFPARYVKLSRASWEKKYYGICTPYYTRRLGFDIKSQGFDRDILDEGDKALRGRWVIIGTEESGTATGSSTATGTGGCPLNPQLIWQLTPLCGLSPDPSNPADFIRVKDTNGENMHVILDGAGVPIGNMGLSITAIGYDAEELVFSVTTSTSHGLIVGDEVQIVGANPSEYNGTYEVTEFISPTVFIATADTPFTQVYVSGGKVVFPGATPGNIHVEYYREANLLLLGIPSSF